jgi:hypothetical protein
MNDTVYAQLYRNEIENRLMQEQLSKMVEENTKRTNFVNANRRFNKQ